MRKLGIGIVTLLLSIVLLSASVTFAQDESSEKLAQESIAKAKETASTTPTAKMIKEKVDEAAALVAKEGEAAFAKFRGKDSNFIFAGTYIWVHEPDTNTMLCHPIKYKMEGNAYSHLKDKNGKFFFVEMSKIGKDSGSGWVDYMWPKPGEKTPSPKVSYIKLAEKDGKKYIVGCGVYDISLDDIKKELGE